MADARSGGGLKEEEEEEEEEEEIELELDLGLSIGGGFRKPEKSTRVDGSAAFSDLDSDRDSLSKERDVHSLRRLEARRKRDEKQLKNGAEGGHGDSECDKVRLEARRARDRVRDREAKENEANLDSVRRECNREGNRDGREETKSVECEELLNNGNRDQCLNPIGYNAFSGQFPVVPVQHSCPIPPQYVSLHNANGFPFLMPCWAPAGANSDSGKNRNSSAVSNGSSRDAETKELASNGSPGHSSSAVSDHRSSSHRGGAGGSSNSDTRSHISNPQPVQTESSARETPTKLEHKASSNQGEPNKEIDKAMDNSAGKKIPTNIFQPIPSSPKESLLTPHDLHKPISTDEKNHGNASLVQMPCVSTTGNGPNGKTINGFLYRYSKSEVTIVCVCHGSSFSPAEFVRHAGGTDISHPLRHITVVPSAFGQ